MSDVDNPVDGDASVDEAALMADLRRTAAVHDPVPAHLLAFARVAPELRRMDDELAELLDTAALAGVRSAASDGVLSFSGSGTSIDIDVTDDRLIGQLVPPASASIALEGLDGVIEEVVSDERGNFSFPVPRGSVRIVAVAESSTTSTEWFVL